MQKNRPLTPAEHEMAHTPVPVPDLVSRLPMVPAEPLTLDAKTRVYVAFIARLMAAAVAKLGEGNVQEVVGILAATGLSQHTNLVRLISDLEGKTPVGVDLTPYQEFVAIEGWRPLGFESAEAFEEVYGPDAPTVSEEEAERLDQEAQDEAEAEARSALLLNPAGGGQVPYLR
jgi:hypothetical protein